MPIVNTFNTRGAGSPEGKVAAPVGSVYTDSEATSGAIRWIKTVGAGTSGWAVEYGDTGWRDITDLVTPAPTSGRLLVARTAGELRLYFDHLTMPEGGSGTLATLPTGLRPAFTQGGPVQGVSSRAQVSNYGYVQVYSWSTSAMIGTLAAKLPAGWPTTRPGTPA